jgi:hypothetical protein
MVEKEYKAITRAISSICFYLCNILATKGGIFALESWHLKGERCEIHTHSIETILPEQYNNTIVNGETECSPYSRQCVPATDGQYGFLHVLELLIIHHQCMDGVSGICKCFCGRDVDIFSIVDGGYHESISVWHAYLYVASSHPMRQLTHVAGHSIQYSVLLIGV